MTYFEALESFTADIIMERIDPQNLVRDLSGSILSSANTYLISLATTVTRLLEVARPHKWVELDWLLGRFVLRTT